MLSEANHQTSSLGVLLPYRSGPAFLMYAHIAYWIVLLSSNDAGMVHQSKVKTLVLFLHQYRQMGTHDQAASIEVCQFQSLISSPLHCCHYCTLIRTKRLTLQIYSMYPCQKFWQQLLQQISKIHNGYAAYMKNYSNDTLPSNHPPFVK